jgi:hypothetical protein
MIQRNQSQLSGPCQGHFLFAICGLPSRSRTALRSTFHVSRFTFHVLRSHALPFTLLALLLLSTATGRCASPDALFQQGITTYKAGNYARAAQAFRESVARQPASGALLNLGNAEWQLGETGPAILAWERALWLDPFNQAAHQNLRFARKIAQIESPDLSWDEVVSTWLPVNWWAWITGGSLWLALSMTLLPGIFRWRKAAWHQAAAAVGLMVFLLSLPAHFGVHARSKLGFVLQKDTPLRLTPTSAGQITTHLGAGEPARVERTRGRYLLIRTSHSTGWIEPGQFSFLCPKS